MRLVSFTAANRPAFGALTSDGAGVVDLTALAPDLLGFVALGAGGLARAKEAVAAGRALPLAEVTLQAPFPNPSRTIICVGKNYREHAAEFHGSGFDATAGTQAIPDVPIIFVKHPSAVTGPGMPIVSANDPTNSLDYEGELTVVIGEPARRVKKADALKHVYGYTIINDATARVLQNRHKQWYVGKSPDTFCPMGPALVTADEVGDVTQCRLRTYVNGELRQDASVADLIFDIPTLIETLSETSTLQTGDLIATGTPAGVGIGFDPPKYLHPGDTVRIVVDRIGELINPVA